MKDFIDFVDCGMRIELLNRLIYDLTLNSVTFYATHHLYLLNTVVNVNI